MWTYLGEYAPGTDLRYVTLTGRVGALHSAHVRLCEVRLDHRFLKALPCVVLLAVDHVGSLYSNSKV